MTQIRNKERNSDRIVVLKVKDGAKAKSSTGLIDPRVFSGENKLHLTRNPRSMLWNFKYESGGLPDPLKQQFTRFDIAVEFAKNYFAGRNIEIVEIID